MASEGVPLCGPEKTFDEESKRPPHISADERFIRIEYIDLLIVDEKPIGEGGFGAVFKALHRRWNCQVAYKSLNTRHMDNKEDIVKPLKKEAEIHRQLRHPNIVSMLGVVLEDNNYGLVLEYICYGSLDGFLEHLKKRTGSSFSITPRVKSKMAMDVCCGMSYLHSIRVIHGDLKIQNILIGEKLSVKISDFGLSKWRDFSCSTSVTTMIHSTITHLPPEKLNNLQLRPDEKFDVYSFGILLWEMFTEEKAFKDCRGVEEIIVTVSRGEQAKHLSLDSLPSEVSDSIASCWKGNPRKRPTFDDVKMLLGSDCDIQHDMKRVLSIYHQLLATTEHGRKLEQVSQTLGGTIRRTNQILTHLLKQRAVTAQEYDEIRSQSTVYNLTRHLIDVLSIKEVTAYQCFLDALNKTDQQHLCQLLEQGVEVDIGHREVLIDQYLYLKTNLNVTETMLLDHLLQSRVLDEQEVDEIKSKRTELEIVDQLLHFIMRTSPVQYQLFLEALRAMGKAYIIETLQANRQALAMTLSKQFKLSSERKEVSKGLGGMFKKIFTRSEPTNGLSAVKEKYSNEAIDRGRSTLFLSQSTVVGVIPGADKGRVYGIAVLGSQLFIAHYGETSVEVYDTINVNTTPRLLKISDETLNYPLLAACSHYNCLYVRHYISDTEPVMYRVKLSNSSVSRWRNAADYGRRGGGLSITNDHNVLVTMYITQRVLEYSTRGSLIRVISLDDSIECPQHCIQLSDGNFVICHCGSTQHRVCMVDSSGRIIKSYGRSKESGVDQLNYPYQLSVDKYDHVFVADRDNNRIQLLNPALTLLGTVQIPGHRLDHPFALHFDQINHRLYVNSYSDVLIVELTMLRSKVLGQWYSGSA